MMQAKSAGMSYLHKIVAGFIFRLVAQSLKSTVTADYVAVMIDRPHIMFHPITR